MRTRSLLPSLVGATLGLTLLGCGASSARRARTLPEPSLGAANLQGRTDASPAAIASGAITPRFGQALADETTWIWRYPIAAQKLGKWVAKYPQAADEFFGWAGYHADRASQLFEDAAASKGSFLTLAARRGELAELDELNRRHPAAMEELIDWSRRNPIAATDLAATRQVHFVGERVYGTLDPPR